MQTLFFRSLLITTTILAILADTSHADLRSSSREVRAARKEARQTTRPRSVSSVCSSSRPLSGLLVKSQISHHISSGDPRAAGYTLVCGRSCVQFIADFYYCDGTKAGSFGYYGRWNGNGKARAYGAAGGAPAHSVRAIQATARKKRCGSTLYLKTQRKAKAACLTFNAFSARTGSPF
jgi:hypothetical protein